MLWLPLEAFTNQRMTKSNGATSRQLQRPILLDLVTLNRDSQPLWYMPVCPQHCRAEAVITTTTVCVSNSGGTTKQWNHFFLKQYQYCIQHNTRLFSPHPFKAVATSLELVFGIDYQCSTAAAIEFSVGVSPTALQYRHQSMHHQLQRRVIM